MDEVQHGEGHGEQAEEDVGQGQVGYQDISGSLQHLNISLISISFILSFVLFFTIISLYKQ